MVALSEEREQTQLLQQQQTSINLVNLSFEYFSHISFSKQQVLKNREKFCTF